MSRFTMYDRTESQRHNDEAVRVARDEWIRDKADQLAATFPQCAMDFYPTMSRFSPYRVGLDSDEAQDAYAVYVDTICLAKATRLYSEAQFMGEVA